MDPRKLAQCELIGTGLEIGEVARESGRRTSPVVQPFLGAEPPCTETSESAWRSAVSEGLALWAAASV